MHWRTPYSRREAVRGLRVAIVGGGFSGTMVLANLVETGKPGTMVEMFEASGEFGPGVAYGTSCAAHLLNVQAGRMGAFGGGHFVAWLQSEEGAGAAARICPGRELGPTDYLPRALYGEYLKAILRQAMDTAMRRGVGVSLARACVTNVCHRRQDLDLMLDDGGPVRRFDVLVLATGANPPRPLLTARDQRSSHYVNNLWSAAAKPDFPDTVGRLDRTSTVLILGTGLTAIDAVLALESHGYQGRIIASSRHGRLPNGHTSPRPTPWNWTVDPDRIAPSALAYLSWLKHEARLARLAGADWRSVFEALRPITRRLWRNLDPAEQAKLLRRHSLWSVHRHRVAPEAQAKIDALRAAGRLDVIAARITSLSNWLGSFRVRLRRRGAAKDDTLRPALIINCTGPEHDIARAGDKLLSRLMDRALIVRSPNGAGIAVEPDGTARSAAAGRVFAVGPLLMGDQFEATAVPELRECARWVASRIAEIDPERHRAQRLEATL